MRLVGTAVLAALGAAACSVDVPIDGKRCPCAEGYECDVPLDRCVPAACDGAVRAADVEASWTTPNALALRWRIEGPPADLLRYEVLVAENEDDLFTRGGSARLVTAADSPELGATPPATSVVVRELSPSTAYLARVVAVDVRQCSAASAVAGASTPADATGYVALFEDAVTPPAYASPAAGLTVEGGELVYTPADDPECSPTPGADPLCGQPLRVQGLSVPLAQVLEAPGVTDKTFARAFVEVRLENTGDHDSPFSELSLWPNACAELGEIYELAGFGLTARPGYQVVQVPLAALVDSSGQPLTFGVVDTSASGTPLCGFAIGAQWNKSGRVRVDRVRVRY